MKRSQNPELLEICQCSRINCDAIKNLPRLELKPTVLRPVAGSLVPAYDDHAAKLGLRIPPKLSQNVPKVIKTMQGKVLPRMSSMKPPMFMRIPPWKKYTGLTRVNFPSCKVFSVLVNLHARSSNGAIGLSASPSHQHAREGSQAQNEASDGTWTKLASTRFDKF